MKNLPPITEPAGTDGKAWSNTWSNFFTQVFKCLRWEESYSFTFDYAFGLVAANSELASSGFPIPGVTLGNAVQITPMNNQIGIIFTGVVTAQNVVTIYAKNFTGAGITPASNTFRIIVLQN
jgi:hypothetical protein